MSDFFDFSIYVDADVDHVRSWYVDRFLALYDTVFQSDDSYFHRFALLSRDEAVVRGGVHLGRHQRAEPDGEHPPDARPRLARSS